MLTSLGQCSAEKGKGNLAFIFHNIPFESLDTVIWQVGPKMIELGAFVKLKQQWREKLLLLLLVELKHTATKSSLPLQEKKNKNQINLAQASPATAEC